jgi:hypothetical protein
MMGWPIQKDSWFLTEYMNKFACYNWSNLLKAIVSFFQAKVLFVHDILPQSND